MPKQIEYLRDIISFTDEACVNNLRMSRNAFGRLCFMLENAGGFVNTRNVQVINPESIQEDCTNDRWKWYKGCLGALDGTYILVQVAHTDKGLYRNRKGNLFVNVLAICDINKNYVYILSGWEGSAADNRVLKNAITRENDLRVPNGSYYLCDSGKEIDFASSQVRFANTQGKEAKSTRRLWSVQEERALACALKELVVQGYKSDNGFKTGNQIVFEQLMRQAMSGTNLQADPHINSRIQTDSNTCTMRHKTWPLYKEWIEIFGKDRATGAHAEGFADIVQDVLNNGLTQGKGKDKEVEGNYVPLFNNSQFDEVQSMDVSRGTNSNVSKSKTSRKRKQADEEDGQFIAAFNSFSDKVDGRLGDISKRFGFEHDALKSRKEVFKALSEVSGLTMAEQVIVSHYLVNKTQSMDLFFSLPNDAKTTMVKLLLEGRFIG
ncbi:hypothetical protein BUALT_Bualt06G0048400 [Buddleja alternifolia]|uniref:DDE Tnp4 domain-containing protein n=1 Tax=Buddleja alternifolia TaxID=168488 RepID=A0AAV6XKQ9_9LAMI|nr:hypothetical protein BUALT_Bualt06G0048400 [Buddleja alternifolia]